MAEKRTLAAPQTCDPPAADVLGERLPPPLRPLARIAFDLAWTWEPGASDVFRDVAPERWDGNPVRLLRDTPMACLHAAAADAGLVARIDALAAALDASRARPYAAAPPATEHNPIAFFCSEYALHQSLPIYSGGLGVLAGDFLKEASDLALPLVGVGLFYRRGYFHQRLDPSGWQHESWTTEAPETVPLTRVHDPTGEPLEVHVVLRNRPVAIAVWRVSVGRIPLFLLDTDLPQNAPLERFVSAQLYIGNRDLRLMQYGVLGIGGVRALRAMGIEPAVVHMNEGHAALAPLELARPEIEAGMPWREALARARARTVFTTHTPVAAGNERYSDEEVRATLGHLPWELGIGADDLFSLARPAPGNEGTAFGMTELALRTSRSANGVSRSHGEVARAMWQPLWPDRDVAAVPISHVTNGVHLPTWMPAPMRALFTRHLGRGWEARCADPACWAFLESVPDGEVWAVRNELRASLVELARTHSIDDRLARGEPLTYVEAAARTFEPDVLTIGFARRIASYKRLHLIVQDVARALALLRSDRPIQVVIAGKAHPNDEGAKRIVQQIFAMKSLADVGSRVVFLEDYDLAVAPVLVAGCDVWVNMPRPPLEASGTSGMKAALAGGLNLSVLDGWWAEAFGGDNGWAISAEPGLDADVDARDARAFYSLLESEVVPMFHDRENGVPRRWIQRVKASLRSNGSVFNTTRMVKDYVGRIYGV